jgi:acyl transferase domain-containing protein/acyl carrier protein
MQKEMHRKRVFLYSGEGTRNEESSFVMLKQSRYWSEIETILTTKFQLTLEEIWNNKDTLHHCPYSPVLTLTTQICLSDMWMKWGYTPDVMLGHSTGELAAAFQAGLYSLEDIMTIAFQIGKAASNLNGKMLHGFLSDEQIAKLNAYISSFNFVADDTKHITLSGYPDDMNDFARQYPDFVEMRLPHPWHHPDYQQFLDHIDLVNSNTVPDWTFVSGVTQQFENHLQPDHWRRWLTQPIDFIESMKAIQEQFDDHQFEIIEIGYHPVLTNCCEILSNYQYASSMYRDEDEIKWIMHQRKNLDQDVFLESLARAVQKFMPDVDFDAPLSYQGFTSLTFVQFSEYLQDFFPSLSPQDFYRFKSINSLIDQFGIEKELKTSGILVQGKNEVVIAGMSCRFPADVESLSQFWNTLLSREDQVRKFPERGDFEAGLLNDQVTRFDHQYFNISDAEAETMDPQQMLALELAELLWQDAGIDPKTIDKRRTGVYMGVWNQEYSGRKESVYYPTGTNPSIVAARISSHYDLRGPCWVTNTACSSSLVALHYAAKDIEAGRVDYAIAGGVNMLLGEDFTGQMRKSGFLSKDSRCKTFDDSANGYVRAEGGGLVLLVNKRLADRYYANVLGSSINHNGARPQIITAPHAEAQEELIIDACQDAGILPQEVSYVECHGTGTKIGDPIEISALQNTIAKDRLHTCYLGSVKSNIGHLESAAGIAGLIKSALILNQGLIPPNLHFQQPNQYVDFESYHLKVVAEETPIEQNAIIGISSFGFGGSNAHVIIKGVDDGVRKSVSEHEAPFNRGRARPLTEYYHVKHTLPQNQEQPEAPAKLERKDVEKAIKEIFYKLTSIEEIDPEVEFFEQGLDSMSVTELISQLETLYNIQIDPADIFDYPLIDQFVGYVYGLLPSEAPVKIKRQDVEKSIRDIFYKLTSIEEIDPEVEFFEQGLDSMSVTELISQLETLYNIQIDPADIFDYPLIDQFIDYVHGLIQ